MSGTKNIPEMKGKPVSQEQQNAEDIKKLKEGIAVVKEAVEVLGANVGAVGVAQAKLEQKLLSKEEEDNRKHNEMKEGQTDMQNSLQILKDMLMVNNNKIQDSGIKKVIVKEGVEDHNKLTIEELSKNNNDEAGYERDAYRMVPGSTEDSDSVEDSFSYINKIFKSTTIRGGDKEKLQLEIIEDNEEQEIEETLDSIWYQIHGDENRKVEKIKPGVKVLPPKPGDHQGSLNGFANVTEINNKPENFKRVMLDIDNIIRNKHMHTLAWDNGMITLSMLFQDIKIFEKLVHVVSNKVIIL